VININNKKQAPPAPPKKQTNNTVKHPPTISLGIEELHNNVVKFI